MAKALLAIILALACALSPVAQSAGPPTAAVAATQPGPAWASLTPAQQQALAPVQGDWPALDAQRRKKLVTLADRYPKMTPEQQRRFTARLPEWVKLTPEQHKAAREKYRALKKLPPEKQQQVKSQYQMKHPEAVIGTPPAATPVTTPPPAGMPAH